jgi:hypothetical protein
MSEVQMEIEIGGLSGVEATRVALWESAMKSQALKD